MPTDQVAGFFDNFPGLRNYRDQENGAEWVTRNEQARTRIQRDPLDWSYKSLPNNEILLRVWSPELAEPGASVSLNAAIEKVSGDADPPTGGENLQPTLAHEIRVTFNKPLGLTHCPYERVYACPTDLGLEPHAEYQISGWVRGADKDAARFNFVFRTDEQGRPAAY